jgi:hypothetical protein
MGLGNGADLNVMASAHGFEFKSTQGVIFALNDSAKRVVAILVIELVHLFR